jgi:hypothetical protein
MKYRVKRHPVIQPLNQSYKIIPLTHGQNTIVDAADFDWLNQWNWFVIKKENGTFYAGKKDCGKVVLMHCFIIGCKQGEQLVDHKNQNGLDNRRKNLRRCTQQQNQCNRGKTRNNTSGFKGVFTQGGKWRSCITVNQRSIYLGVFSSPKEAAICYDKAAKRYFGEFAYFNFH